MLRLPLPTPALLCLFLAGCSPARPYYVGPGRAGSALPYAPRPAWVGHDTAATYLTGFGGPGYQYNEFDRSSLYGGQLHRAWSRPHWSAAAGLLGGVGSYQFNVGSPPLASLTYRLVGFTSAGSLNVHSRSRLSEWRILTFRYSLTRERGEATSWRRHPTAQFNGRTYDMKVRETWGRRWLPSFAIGTEFIGATRRPWYPCLGFGAGIELVGHDQLACATALASSGPFQLSFQIKGAGQYQIGSVRQLALSYAIGRWPTASR